MNPLKIEITVYDILKEFTDLAFWRVDMRKELSPHYFVRVVLINAASREWNYPIYQCSWDESPSRTLERVKKWIYGVMEEIGYTRITE